MYRRATISRSPIRRRSSGRWMASAAQAISCNDAGAGPAPNRKSVYNFRSEGREFTSGRCLIIADGFYEFTDPEDNKKKRKDKWLFRKKGEPWFCIAGIWRTNKDVGEAFTMLTMELGPDIAPYHDRQIAILDRADWTDWLDPAVSAKTGNRSFRPEAAGRESPMRKSPKTGPVCVPPPSQRPPHRADFSPAIVAHGASKEAGSRNFGPRLGKIHPRRDSCYGSTLLIRLDRQAHQRQ